MCGNLGNGWETLHKGRNKKYQQIKEWLMIIKTTFMCALFTVSDVKLESLRLFRMCHHETLLLAIYCNLEKS